MGQDNVVTIRGAYDLFARGDFARMPFDPRIEWIEPDVEGLSVRGTHHGPEAVIKEVFESAAIDGLDNFRLQCDQYLDAGDLVVVTGRFLGTREGYGKRVERAVCTHLDFAKREGGSVPELHRYRELASGVVSRPY